jgi:hypothetical protein
MRAVAGSNAGILLRIAFYLSTFDQPTVSNEIFSLFSES